MLEDSLSLKLRDRLIHSPSLLPSVVGIIGLVCLIGLWMTAPDKPVVKRIPGTDHAVGSGAAVAINPGSAGKLTFSTPVTSTLNGTWAGFLGPLREGKPVESKPMLLKWDSVGPKAAWGMDLGEGYAGAAVYKGKVYLVDYDQAGHQSLIRCIALETGLESWRYAYPLTIKRNHGMSRTVPAVNDRFLVAMDPKCNLVCLDPNSGKLLWAKSLTHDYGTVVPPWYTGQCPLIDGDRVIIAPAGKEVLFAALDIKSGNQIWSSPNTNEWKMTHSSITPMVVDGELTYLYCGSGGVAAVSAKDGRPLWDTKEWKISIATVPSPLVIGEGKVFLTGGYNAGCAMLQITREAGQFKAKTLFKKGPEVFGATQHTPTLYQGHIFGVRADGQFTCLNTEGKVVWTSGPGINFGLGGFLVTEAATFILNDSGKLSVIETSTSGFKPIASAQVLQGRESWAPMALADGRLLIRDLTHISCLDLTAR